jgi:prepilin-type N-terminal cleavage/methylation domain-containing protein
MKFNRASRSSNADRAAGSRRRETAELVEARANSAASRRWRQRGFTLAEVLAALVFMAIVIPVTLQGVRIASRAGSVAERKAVAARLAERKLNELIVTGQWQSSASWGTLSEGWQTYDWEVESESWAEDGVMRVLTVRVTVPVQGEDYDVRISTLVDATQ